MKHGWEYKKLKDVCDKGASNIQQNKIAGVDGDYAVYGASGYVQNIDFYHQEKPYIGIVKDGSGVGRVNVYPAKTSLLGTMQYILPKQGVSLGYIAYVLKGLNLAKFASGAAIPHIYFRDYGESFIPVPPIKEQEEICSLLDKLSLVIEKKKEQVKQLDNLAQSIFYDMFGDPVENDMGWEVKTLNSVGTVARGVSKHRPRNAPELLGDYMPFIQTGDIANSGMYITACQSGYSELGVEQSKIWHKGTLCITIAANIGKCAIMTFDACFPDSVVGFIADSSITLVEYVFYYFRCIQQALEDNAMGVAQKNINLGILNVMNIPVPPLSLQQSFAQKVGAIERQKELINQSIAEVQTLFDSQMEYYFGE